MSSSGSKTTGSTTTSTKLTDGVTGALSGGLKDAQSLYDSGSLYQPYTGSTVVPYAPETEQSWNGIQTSATANSPGLQYAYNNIGNIANGTGLDPNQNSALAQLQAVAGDANGSYAQSNLQKYANGSLIGASNPAFEKVLARTQTDAQDAVQRSASAAGRYGSGIAQGNVAREVGDVTANALSSQYNQDVQNQFAANGQLDSQRLANLGIRQSAAGDIFNAGQQGQQNRMTAAGMLPTLFDATLDPARALAGIGAQKEDLATRQTNDNLRIFQEQQQQKQKSIEWLTQLATGQAGTTGSTTTTASAPRTNPFLAGLGGSIAGATTFGGGITGAGSVAGGLLGGLSSLF